VTRWSASPEQRRDWLRLARTENVGPVTFEQLIQRYGDASAVLDVLPDLARRGGRVGGLKVPSIAEAEAELEAGEKIGARLILSREAAFPRLLAVLDPPPPLIWTLGAATRLAAPSVAIVGARTASAAGQRFARMLAEGVGQAGFVVVSGLARGVDGAAHEGALATGTVAVLGGGVDDVYPPEHRDLYARIADQGAIVSENAIGRRAVARDFPRRNRLISGLSLGVVVVEAEMRSGSLITARLAAEQGREVFAVPGSPLDPRCAGCNDLIRQGATLCGGVDDILRVLESLPRLEEPRGTEWEPAAMDHAALDRAADALRERLAALLSVTPVSRDELGRLVGAPVPAVNAALIELELAGRACLLGGGFVALP
jgi:DNA processing protein